MQIKTQNRRDGLYLRLSYIAPRCRKAVSKGFSGDTIDQCTNAAMDYLKHHKGRYISGVVCPCQLWDSEFKGEVITMYSVGYGKEGNRVDQEFLMRLMK